MAWNDKPTPGQTGALARAVEALIYTDLDHAVEIGATARADALRELLDQEVVSEAVYSFADDINRMQISHAIQLAERKYFIPAPIRKAIDHFLRGSGQSYDEEYVLGYLLEQRKKEARGGRS